MNALPDPLPAGAIHHLNTVSIANLDANKYYFMRYQRPAPSRVPGRPAAYPFYKESVIYTDANAPEQPWKNERRVILKVLFERTYKRIFDAAIVSAAGVQLQADAAEHNGKIVDFDTYMDIVGDGERWYYVIYQYLPFAGGPGEFVYNQWQPKESNSRIYEYEVKEHPAPGDYAYTFYAMPQAGGRANSRSTNRRRTYRRRNTHRRRTYRRR